MKQCITTPDNTNNNANICVYILLEVSEWVEKIKYSFRNFS